MERNNILHLAQITDIHIGPEDVLYNNINVRENFLRTIEDVKNKGPFDYVILSGDLAIDFGEIEAYYWIKEQLQDFPFPIVYMSGNHDSIERMDRVFDLHNDIKEEMLFFKREFKGLPVIFLDSEPDHIDARQLDWLVETSKSYSKDVLLFIHHPPLLMDCEFMDRKYPLRNHEEVFSKIKECENIKHVFTGHYHSEGQKTKDGINVYTAPATQMQIDKTNHDFELSDIRPGWREISWDGSSLRTDIHMVEL